MMKWNRMCACALSFVMLMGLCACGGGDETAEDTEQIVAQKVTIVTGDDVPELEDPDYEPETSGSAAVTTTVKSTDKAAGTTVAATVKTTVKGTEAATKATTKKVQYVGGNSSGNTSSNNNSSGNTSSNNNSSSGNTAKTTTAPVTTTTATTTTTTEYVAPEDVDKYVDFGTIADGDGYTYDGTILNISAPGTYHLTGELYEGQIYVNVGNEDKVKLRLNGVGIVKTGAPCIQIDNADKVTVNVVDGSSNYLECYTTNAEADAALYSKDDLKIKGFGSLYVFCDNEHGVACNNDLEIEECTLTVDAEKTGISTHKTLLIESGNIITNGDNCGIRSWDLIEINGGSVVACGGKKSAVDRGGIISDTGNFYINGGTVFAVGMNQTIPIGQTSAVAGFPEVLTKDNIVAVSIDGMTLASAVPNKKYSTILISDPSLYVGGICDVWLNDVHFDNFTLTDTITQVTMDGTV